MIEWDKMRGWLGQEVAEAMRKLILQTKPDVMVEIGVFAGKSLINAAVALKQNGHGVIYGIDPWRLEDAVKGLGSNEAHDFWDVIDLDAVHWDCMRAIWDRGLEKQAIIIRAPSQYVHRLFRGKSIDILYIDGGHSEERSCSDVENYLPKVKHGGYIWFDDVEWDSTRKAVEWLESTCLKLNNFGNAHLYKKI